MKETQVGHMRVIKEGKLEKTQFNKRHKRRSGFQIKQKRQEMKKRNNGGNMKQTKNKARGKKLTKKYFEEHNIIEIINSVHKQNSTSMTAVAKANRMSKCKVITPVLSVYTTHCFTLL